MQNKCYDDGKISVIIPVYNAEHYLDFCIESIVMQTCKNLEILIIDDGSTDNSPALCDQWAQKDTRIRVIHKLNGGQSDARNVGIDNATGEYLLFVDADDYIEDRMCEALRESIERNQADVVICGFCWEYKNFCEKHSLNLTDGFVVDRDEILELWAKMDSANFVMPVNKLYKKRIFFTSEHIRYPVGRIHEDEAICYRVLYAAEKIAFSNECFYHYVYRKGSTTSTFNEKNYNDFFSAIREYISWSDTYAPNKRKVMECMTVRKIFFIMRKYCENRNMQSSIAFYKKLNDYLTNVVDGFINNPFATKKDKLKYLIFKSKIYVYVLNIYKMLQRR